MTNNSTIYKADETCAEWENNNLPEASLYILGYLTSGILSAIILGLYQETSYFTFSQEPPVIV